MTISEFELLMLVFYRISVEEVSALITGLVLDTICYYLSKTRIINFAQVSRIIKVIFTKNLDILDNVNKNWPFLPEYEIKNGMDDSALVSR